MRLLVTLNPTIAVQVRHQIFGHGQGPFSHGNVICTTCNGPWFDNRHSLYWRIGRAIGAIPQFRNQTGNWMAVFFIGAR